MKEKIRIGIIGTGFAKTVQIPAFQRIEGAEVVSIASGRAENAAKVAREFNISHWTGDWRETVSHRNVDLVCITTPPDLHHEMTLFALANEKHILCEKPMAMNAAETREMLEKSREKPHLLAVIDHELRYLSGREKAFQLIREGAIGKIRHIKYDFRAPHRGDINLPWTWWSDEKQGGGTLGAIGSHVFDTLRWFAGSEVSEIFCQLQSHVKERRDSDGKMRKVTSDDEVNAILRFAAGELTEDATANISLSMVEYPAYQNRVEIFGTKSALRVEYDGALFSGNVAAEKWEKIEVSHEESMEGERKTGWNNGFLAFAKRIVRALQNGETRVAQAATFADGHQIQLLLDAARKSSESGCKVKVQND